MIECRPGRRLLAESGQTARKGTVGGVLPAVGHADKCWVVSAGHMLEPFGANQFVDYFPDDIRTRLGVYVPIAQLGPGVDLARIEAQRSMVLFAPVGFPLAPTLQRDRSLANLQDQPVVFLGGLSGKIKGRVLGVEQHDHHPQAIIVRLSCSNLISGDSGGPLYLQSGNDVEWIGTLVGERPGSSSQGFTDALFLHPGLALTQLGI